MTSTAPVPSPTDDARTDAAIPVAVAPAAADRWRRPAIEPSRPFGAHVRTRWWAPIAAIVTLGIAMVGLQIVLVTPTMIIEHLLSERPFDDPALSPLMLLATNLSLIAMLPLSLLAMRWIGGVPWRRALTVDRPFAWGMLLRRFALFGVIVLVLTVGSTALLPDGFSNLALSSTAVAFLIVTVLTTPLQAAAEEVMFRGAIMPLVGSWFRSAGAAVVVGLIVSSLLFGASHGATDPYLALYYTMFGVCAALMAVISRGLETSIAFHAANNTALFAITAITLPEGGLVLDRSAGAGGPWVLGLIALDLAAVGFVWLLER